MNKEKYIITENGQRASDTMDKAKAEVQLAKLNKKVQESKASTTPAPKLAIKQNLCG